MEIQGFYDIAKIAIGTVPPGFEWVYAMGACILFPIFLICCFAPILLTWRMARR